MVDNDPELGIDEVAELLKKTPRAVQKMCSRGDVFPGARKTGPYKTSAWVIPQSDVDAYLEKYPPPRK